MAPDEAYLPDLIDATRGRGWLLSFTAVGYGTGEKFPIPGEETDTFGP